MPKQLLLLDDEDTSRAATSAWSRLPQEVRAALVEKLAEVLVRVVQGSTGEADQSDDTH